MIAELPMRAATRTQGRDSWPTVRFGDIVRNVKVTIDPETSGLDRYIAGEHMESGDLHIRRWGTVGDGYLGPAFHRKFVAGQVLYGSRRTYLRKVAVAEFDGICANTTFVLEPAGDDLLPELLPFIMHTEAFTEHAVKNSKGSVNPYVNWGDIASFRFALPPKDEQRRIADILWAADAARGTVDRVAAASQRTRVAMIADFVDAFTASHELMPLNSIIDDSRPITYGILKPGLGVPGGVPVVKVKDYPAGVIIKENLLLTEPSIDYEYRRSRLKAGDLLLSIRGTIGRVAEVPLELEGANITQDTARLAIRAGNHVGYVRSILESGFVQGQIRSAITGNAVKGINIGEVRKILLPVPPYEEQERMTLLLDELSEATSAATQHLRETISLSQALLGAFI